MPNELDTPERGAAEIRNGHGEDEEAAAGSPSGTTGLLPRRNATLWVGVYKIIVSVLVWTSEPQRTLHANGGVFMRKESHPAAVIREAGQVMLLFSKPKRVWRNMRTFGRATVRSTCCASPL